MASETYQLALLLTLKDLASGGLDRFQAKLLAAGKDGEKYRQTLVNIRSELNKGMGLSAAGFAGLAVLGKGVQVAGDFQASMTELRSSFSRLKKDGTIDTNALGRDMQRAEVVAMRLGNALPGTTEDFVQMMQVLRQNGLGVETILNGAADAVGNLAVASNAVPREIAADFAQFGNLFKLRADDFAPAADIFSKIYTSTGQTSTELVEAAKYFQGRAGVQLGLGGLKDAEQYTRLFGMMGKEGMRGSMAGMSLTNFFQAYNAHRDKLDDLAKATGIKLDFFDKKGKFVGLEEVIRQMSQFNKLSAKDRTAWMEELFGTLGSGAASMLANADGWKAFNAEQDKTIGLAAKNAEVAKNFNNQLEALTGSLKNLVVTGFGPLLPTFTNAAQGTNALVGSIIDFGRANPTLVSVIAKLALLGTTAVTLVGIFKTVSNAWRLMQFAAKFSSEERVINFFRKVKENAESTVPAVTKASHAVVTSSARTADAVTKSSKAIIAATESSTASVKKGFAAYVAADRQIQTSVAATGARIADTEKKVGKLRGSFQALGRSPMVSLGAQIGVVMIAEAAVMSFVEHLMTGRELSAKVKLNVADMKAQFDELLLSGELFRPPGYKSGAIDASVAPALNLIEDGGRLMRQLHPERTSPDDSYFKQITGANFWEDIVFPPAYGVTPKAFSPTGETINFNPRVFAKMLQEGGIGQYGRDPNQLAALLRSVNSIPGATVRDVEMITEAIKIAIGGTYPDNLTKALELVAKEQGKPAPGEPRKSYETFPSVQDLRTPWNVQPFDINRPFGRQSLFSPPAEPFRDSTRKPEPPKPAVEPMKLFDLVKGSTEVFDKLSALNEPIAVSVGHFTSLNKPVGENVTSFFNLSQPTPQVATAFGDLLPHAQRTPSALQTLVSGARNVGASLDTLSSSIASWRPPAVGGSVVMNADGTSTFVPHPSRAIGGVVERHGFAYVHAGNVITPARVTKGLSGFDQLMTWVRESRNQAQTPSIFNSFKVSTGEASTTNSSTTITGNNRPNYPLPKLMGVPPELATLDPAVATLAGGKQATAARTNVTINAPLSVTVNGGGEKAKDEFAGMLQAHARRLMRDFERAIDMGRNRD